VRYASPGLGAWGSEVAVILQDEEDSAVNVPASNLGRTHAMHNREVLQIIDAMASFNAGSAGLEVRGKEIFSPMDFVGLVADARAA
jgi:hypothetical protein